MNDATDGTQAQPYSPYRVLVLHGLLGLVICGLWIGALAKVHAPIELKVLGACGLVLIGMPLALGWLVVMLAWARVRSVLRAQAVALVLLGLTCVGSFVVAFARHLSFHYTPGIITAMVVWGVRLWGHASGWSHATMKRASWRVGTGMAIVEVVLLLFAIRAMLQIFTQLPPP